VSHDPRELVREILVDTPPGAPETLAKRIRTMKRAGRKGHRVEPFGIGGNVGSISITPAGAHVYADWDLADPENVVELDLTLAELERVVAEWLAR
jgi:hypothetical protein